MNNTRIFVSQWGNVFVTPNMDSFPLPFYMQDRFARNCHQALAGLTFGAVVTDYRPARLPSCE